MKEGVRTIMDRRHNGFQKLCYNQDQEEDSTMKRLSILLIATVILFAGTICHGDNALNSANSALKQAEKDLEQASQDLQKAMLEYEAQMESMAASMNDQGVENVFLRLTYPVGESPMVFTSGWVFGVECLYVPPDKVEDDDVEPQDLSANVEWTGSGSFNPKVGPVSRPHFNSPGSNTIVLKIKVDGQEITKTIKVFAVSSSEYAHVGSHMKGNCSHGCIGCPHYVEGVIDQGSQTVLIDGKPAARVGDGGHHVGCCGPGSFTIVEGNSQVLIDGKPAVKFGCQVKTCGGVGTVIR